MERQTLLEINILMRTLQIEQQNPIFADIIAFNNIGSPILLIEVKSNYLKTVDRLQVKTAIKKIVDYLNLADQLIPFAMLVTPENIQIFQWNGKNLSKPIVCLQTADILSYYEPEFRNKRIFRLYLTTLVEAWLRDLAYHWKSQNPPASQELAAISLLEKLAGGTTQTEVKIGNDTLR